MKQQQTRALLKKIEAHKERLDIYLDRYAEALAKATPGVPAHNIKTTLGGNYNCLCRTVTRLLKQQVLAAELEQQNGSI